MEESNKKGNKFIGSLSEMPIINYISSLKFNHVIGLLVSLFSVSTAYTLGLLLSLPTLIVRSFNENTFSHIIAELIMMFILIFTFSKFARLVGMALCIYWVFLKCKFKYGFIRQKKWMEEIHNGEKGKKFIIILQIFLTICFFLYVFLGVFDISKNTSEVYGIDVLVLYMIMILLIIFVLSYFSVNNVGHEISHSDFFATTRGRDALIFLTLVSFVLLGLIKTSLSIRAESFVYITDKGKCKLVPMFPVNGGELYFEQTSYSYMILQSDKPTMFYSLRKDKSIPPCL
jgi:hypothetical protein